MKKLISLFMIPSFFWSVCAQKINDIVAIEHHEDIVVSYTIEGGVADKVYSPKLFYSTNGGTDFSPCQSIQVAHGTPGQINQITWNVTQDMVFFESDSIVFKVEAFGYWNFIKGNAEIGGRSYNTIKIGQQEWMAENLNYTINSSYCYGNKEENCRKYGRLYNWDLAKEVAEIIPGWRLPTDEDWKQLERYLGITANEVDLSGGRGEHIGTKLKSATGWHKKGNGTNTLGLRVLPAGYQYHNGGFFYLGKCANFWSATESIGENAWYRELFFDSTKIERNDSNKNYGFSVRLIRN